MRTHRRPGVACRGVCRRGPRRPLVLPVALAPAAVGSRPRRRGSATDHRGRPRPAQGAGHARLGGRRGPRRPGRVPGRHRRPGRGRQRRGCRDRDRRRARGHRAVHRRYRRWRLLRLLRRPTGKVTAIDGRETAPATFTRADLPQPRRHAHELQQRGELRPVRRCAGHPGHLGARGTALRHMDLAALLAPAEEIASEGFVVDADLQHPDRRRTPPGSPLPRDGSGVPARGAAAGGRLGVQEPRHGAGVPRASRQRGRIGLRGHSAGHRGGGQRNRTPGPTCRCCRGRSPERTSRPTGPWSSEPAHSRYRGPGRLRHDGAEPRRDRGRRDAQPASRPTSARTGSATYDLSDADFLHRFSEATATAFADRNRYVGDVAGVPTAS